MKAAELPLDRITWLLALLILPWTFKFVWAPVVDALRNRYWGYRNWILVTQSVMVAALIPLLLLDLIESFRWITICLFVHATAAATQDVAIDALCIESSSDHERASLNGWMQCGMLSGRALMGGGSLILEHWIGFTGVVIVLMTLIAGSSVLVWMSSEPALAGPNVSGEKSESLIHQIKASFSSPIIWTGVAFALIARRDSSLWRRWSDRCCWIMATVNSRSADSRPAL